MSPLTKVFVVLLVVVSLLQTAGTVVFINKVTPLNAQLETARQATNLARSQAAAANEAQLRAEEQIKQKTTEAEEQHKADTSVIGNMQSQIATQALQISQLTAEKAALSNLASTQAQQLTWATTTNGKLSDQVKTLRDTIDKEVHRQEDDSRSIANMTATVETVQSQNQHVTEQLQASQDKIQKLSLFIKSLGRSPDEINQPGFVASNGMDIKGRVVDKREINGSTYVTVNVGTADGVAKGTVFNILGHQGEFLGFCTIETVDQNQSIGKFNGEPGKSAQVEASDDARTRILGS